MFTIQLLGPTGAPPEEWFTDDEADAWALFLTKSRTGRATRLWREDRLVAGQAAERVKEVAS